MGSHVGALRELEQEFGDALFARGYFLGDTAPLYSPAHWKHSPIVGNRVLVHDPRVPLAQATAGAGAVYLLGEVYSVDRPAADADQICRELATLIGKGAHRFYDRLDRLNGRYLIIYSRDGGESLTITTDATGMRSCFYSTDGGFAASHALLLAVHLERGAEQVTSPGYGASGQLSHYHGVVFLTPNQELNLATATMHRYWPRRPLPRHGARRAARRASKLMAKTLKGIVARHPAVVTSLTAGTDSRATVAVAMLARVQHRLEFFTYATNDGSAVDEADKRIAAQLAEMLGLRHFRIELDQAPPVTPRLAALLNANASREHKRDLAVAYASMFGGTDAVHVRSNLSEVGRAFYRKKRPIEPPQSGRDLAAIYRVSVPSPPKPTAEEWAHVQDAFAQFYEATDFAAGARFVDGRDLFYWEHRMGTWHSQVVQESDLAFDSLSLYNSRAVLTALLSPPLRDRLMDRHVRAIMRRADPSLLELPFNPGVVTRVAPLPPSRREVTSARVQSTRRNAVRKTRRTAGAIARRLRLRR